MATNNPRKGLGLAAILIVAAVAVTGVRVFFPPPGRHPGPDRRAASSAPAPAAALPHGGSTAEGETTLVELPPAVPSDQNAAHSSADSEPIAVIPPRSHAPNPGGAGVGPRSNAGWVVQIAPLAGSTGAASATSAGAESSGSQIASTGNGLTVGAISGTGGSGSIAQSAARSNQARHAGWVLIEGGVSGNKAASRGAELFNPVRMRWIHTGSMHHRRQNQTATLLPDGDTLVAGGENARGKAIAAAELYDSAKGRFIKTGAMDTARAGHNATLITGCACGAEGKVLVAGGTTGLVDGEMIASAELYDPATGEFTPTGSMHTARSGATATLIASGPMVGDVLIVGGFGKGGVVLASAELYDPRSGTFTATGSMTTARKFHTATWLGYLKDSGSLAGEILIAGGQTADGVTASAEIYDPAAETFTPINSMTVARATQVAVLMGDGRVLIAGGFGTSENYLSSSEIFDPATGTFTAAAAMTSVHAGADGVLLNDGRILIAGGHSPDADVYNPLSGVFQMTGPLRVALLDAPAVALP